MELPGGSPLGMLSKMRVNPLCCIGISLQLVCFHLLELPLSTGVPAEAGFLRELNLFEVHEESEKICASIMIKTLS